MLKPATRGITVWIVMCHVKACDAGYYGAECDECGHCLDGALCDSTTGRCPEGCEKGYAFDNCTGYLGKNTGTWAAAGFPNYNKK